MEEILLALLAQVPNVVKTLNAMRAAGTLTDEAEVDAALDSAMSSLETHYGEAEAALQAAASE